MKLKSFIVSALALFAFGVQANAEEITKTYPYGFIGLQGGAQMVTNGYAREWSFGDVLTGTGSVYGGVQWTPVLGTRLHLNAWKGREGYKAVGTYYDFNYGTLTADLMVNLVSMFNHRDNNVFNLYLIGGFGGNKVWGDEWNEVTVLGTNGKTVNAYQENLRLTEYQTSSMAIPEGHMAPEANRIAHTEKLGLMLDFALSDHWNINLEADALHHGHHDYLPEVNMTKDWQVTCQLGLTYRFGKTKKVVPATVVEPARTPEPVAEPTPAPAPEPAPAPVVVDEVKPCIQNVFFLINRYDIRPEEMLKVEECVAFLNKYPEAKIDITGYADKNTGNATINLRLSKQRVNAVYDALIQRGIAAERINKDFKGDTVQPFGNDEANYRKNRCTICVAE